MSFGEHLEELRSCLIRAIVGVVLATIVALVFGQDILGIICRPLFVVQRANGLQPQLQALAPMAGFAAYLKIGFLSGLIVAAPWVILQIWRFVAVGLFTHERRFVRSLVPASMILFVVGVLFLYFIALPIVLHFFIRFNQRFSVPDLTPTAFQRVLLPKSSSPPPPSERVEPGHIPIMHEDPLAPNPGDMWINAVTRRLLIQTHGGVWSTPMFEGQTANTMRSQFAIDFYISFVLILGLAFGIAFETPIVVFFLAWSGLVSTAVMGRSRRYVLLAMVMVAAILTPPDVVSQLILATPMYLLFELGLLIARMTQRKPAAAETGG